MWRLLLPLAAAIPALILLGVVSFLRWRRKQRGDRSPIFDKLLRPAGYSLQRRLDELNESFNFWYTMSFLTSLIGLGFFAVGPHDMAGRTFMLIFFGAGALACIAAAGKKLTEVRQCQLGRLGEQAMAEALQPLVPLGYRVFHDVPGQGNWNIDHVAVGPAGVFAIETKYRTKRPGKTGERDHEAIFDGEKIQYPSGYDDKAPRQANANAQWLSGLLSEAVAESVSVQPVVALPGWWVTLKARSNVKVLSGKQVANFIAKEPASLSEKTLQRISYQLEQRCRDVEI